MRGNRAIAWVVLVSGCGRIDFDPRPTADDASGGDAAPPCMPFEAQITDGSSVGRMPLAWSDSTYGVGTLLDNKGVLLAAIDPAGTVTESATIGTSATNSALGAMAWTQTSFALGWTDQSSGYLSFVDTSGARVRADLTSSFTLAYPAWTGSELGVLLANGGANADFERVTGDGTVASPPAPLAHGLTDPRFSHLIATGTGYVVAAVDIAPLPNPVPLHVFQLDASGGIVHDTMVASLPNGNENGFDAVSIGSDAAVAYTDASSTWLRLVHADGTAGAPVMVAQSNISGEVAIASTGTQLVVFASTVSAGVAGVAIRVLDPTGLAVGTPEDLTLGSAVSTYSVPSALGLPDRVLFAWTIGNASVPVHPYLVQRCP